MKYPISYPTIEVIILLLLAALCILLFWTYRLRTQRQKLTSNQATALPPKKPISDEEIIDVVFEPKSPIPAADMVYNIV
ncbi:hypothetical protein L596_026206 [Steinernema carpocapsae]|uniref:Uncharacterized protein n=1 Tax=Steinernema carpocapsae TaxID=34508 RepID=A0A4U5M0Q7_STECR|nr:hypothetical protein L596_026206 [Steinernema carpocapsae]